MDIKEVKCNLAEFRALVDHSDGVIFTGGPDIPPTLYKEETRFTTRVKDPYRHYFEISFLSHLLSKSQNKPLLDDREEYLVLGICLGMQSINVACGGTLYQDILSDIYGLNTIEQACKIKATNKLHRNPYAQLNSGSNLGHGVLHFLKFTEHAPKILVSGSKPISVLSSHHQAIKRLGKNLEVFATSADGKVIEGIVHTRYPNVIGIQFHAEKRVLWDQTIEYCEKDPRCGRNYIADKVRACPQCIDFHRRFWDTISKRLIQSVKRHFSQSVIIGANAYQNIADQYKYGCYYVSACTPTYPVGPCMVSTERTCSAYYKYTL
jgi:putative glutamine amidotransferase